MSVGAPSGRRKKGEIVLSAHMRTRPILIALTAAGSVGAVVVIASLNSHNGNESVTTIQNTAAQTGAYEAFDLTAVTKELNCEANIVAGSVDQNMTLASKDTPEVIAERWLNSGSIPDRDADVAPKADFAFDTASPADSKAVRIKFTKKNGSLTTVIQAQNPSGKGWFLTDHAGCAAPTGTPVDTAPRMPSGNSGGESPFTPPRG